MLPETRSETSDELSKKSTTICRAIVENQQRFGRIVGQLAYNHYSLEPQINVFFRHYHLLPPSPEWYGPSFSELGPCAAFALACHHHQTRLPRQTAEGNKPGEGQRSAPGTPTRLYRTLACMVLFACRT